VRSIQARSRAAISSRTRGGALMSMR